MNGVNSFGNTLRAFRLGYRISRKRGAFVKLSDVDLKTVNVTLVPLYKKVPSKNSKSTHRCWWEYDDGPEAFLDLIPVLKNIRRVKRTISFDIYIETGESVLK